MSRGHGKNNVTELFHFLIVAFLFHCISVSGAQKLGLCHVLRIN